MCKHDKCMNALLTDVLISKLHVHPKSKIPYLTIPLSFREQVPV